MSIVTIDPYYNIQFYNETLQALQNNNVSYKEYVSTKAPYHFYIESNYNPVFLNFDKVSTSYSRFLVNVIRPLTPNAEYLYMRKDSFTNVKGLVQYGINDALASGQSSKEAVFFHATKDEVLSLSKEFPRKIFYFGRYFNRKYRVFFSDSLLVKNYLRAENVLAEGKGFKFVTDVETQLNYRVFRLQDRLLKLSETPYVLNGIYNTISSTVPEISDKYTLN